MHLVRKVLAPAALALVATLGIAEFGNADQTSANADLLKKYIAAFNQHDPEAFKAVIAENYLQHNGRAGQGLSGLQAAARQYFQTFPDFNMALADSIITNDKVVARVEITATHDHPVQLDTNAPVFPPTGKKLSWHGISIWRVSGGKFVEHWDVDDLLSLAQQMRAPPPRK